MSDYCPICDIECLKVHVWHDEQLHNAWEEYRKRLVALAETHAKGEHDGMEVEDA